MLRDIIILHKFTINDNQMMYGSWDIGRDRQIFFVILDHFLPFYNPKYQYFVKIKQMPGDIIILHKCTKNNDHMLCCSWNTAHDGCKCYFSFWAIFCPFTAPKWKFQKQKKHLEMSSFYTCVPKIMIRWCVIPERWCAKDGQTGKKSDT